MHDLSSFRSLFDLMPIGAYRTSREGRQLRANAALVALNGFDSEVEMLAAVNDIGGSWYVEPNRRAQFAALMDCDGKVRDFVSEIYGYKSRKRLWIRENAHQVCNDAGELLFYEGTVEDITQAHMLEHALEKERALMRDLIQTIPDAVWMNDAHGVYQVCNLAYLTRFVPGGSGILGKTAMDLYDEPIARAYRDSDLAVLRSAQTTRAMQAVSNPETGVDDVFEVTKIPMLGPNGQSIGIIGLARDVTARERAFEALLAAKASAEAAASAKADFLANMSHEIRTPLR